MRVLIVAHGYSPNHSAGAELRAQRTVRGLRKRVHEVADPAIDTSSSRDRSFHWEDVVQDGALVRRVYFDLGFTPDPFAWSYDHPQIAQAIDAMVQMWRPTILHFFSGYLIGRSIARIADARKLPLVVSLTDCWWLCHRINLVRTNGQRCSGPSARSFARCTAEVRRRYRMPAQLLPGLASAIWRASARSSLLGRWLGLRAQIQRRAALMQALGRVDAFIAPSHFLANMYLSVSIDASRMHVLRQGVNLQVCPVPGTSAALRFGYIGQMNPHNGPDILLDEWSQLSGDRARSLKLYGSDEGARSYGRCLQERVGRLSEATWAGHFGAEDRWRVRGELDVLVVPSRWVENSPNTILEARAVGIPAIGSDLGGIAELIQHESHGLLFKVDDARGLAFQLQRLLDEPDLLRRLRSSPLPFKSTAESMDEIVWVYDQVLQSYASKRGRKNNLKVLAIASRATLAGAHVRNQARS